MDFSKMSDEELAKIAGSSPAPAPNVSQMSNEELARIANTSLADQEHQQRVEKYRPAAAAEAQSESGANLLLPRAQDVPILGPAMHRGMARAATALGAGEGDTAEERYRNWMAHSQAREQEREKVNPKSYNFARGTFGAASSLALPELGIEKGVTQLGEMAAPLVQKYAPFFGKMAESGAVGGLSAMPETVPGETPEEAAKRVATGTAIGTVAPVAVKAVTTAVSAPAKALQSLWNPMYGEVNALTEKASQAASAAPSKRGMTIEEYNAAKNRGEDVSIADIHGAKDRLNQAAARHPEDQRVAEINDDLARRLSESTQKLGQSIDGVFGKPIDTFASREAAAAEARTINGPAYKEAFSHPNAQNIWNGELNSLINTKEGQSAIDWAVNQSNKEAYTKGAPPFQNPFVKNDNGQWVLPPNTDQPNLQFWDWVKRGLNDTTNQQFISGNKSAANATAEMTKKLTEDLKTLVPPYRNAVDTAGRYIKADNAFDAGSNFFDLANVARRTNDPSEVNRQINAFKTKFSPQEKANMAEGLANNIKENPAQAAKVFAANDKVTMDRYKTILGEDAFNGIDTALRMNRIAAMTKEIGAKAENKSLASQLAVGTGTGAAIGSAGAYAVEHFPQLLQYAKDPVTLLGVSTLAALGWGTKGAVNWQTDRRASTLLDMALSDDPKIQQQLVDAARGNERVRVVLTKMEDDLAKYFASHPSIALGQQDRQGRKAGGRVMRDAISLAQDAVRTRKAIGGKTEQMLSMPDDAIVSALHTAKKTLGGSI